MITHEIQPLAYYFHDQAFTTHCSLTDNPHSSYQDNNNAYYHLRLRFSGLCQLVRVGSTLPPV